nr:unnamed protein product [Digitaria exilis]
MHGSPTWRSYDQGTPAVVAARGEPRLPVWRNHCTGSVAGAAMRRRRGRWGEPAVARIKNSRPQRKPSASSTSRPRAMFSPNSMGPVVVSSHPHARLTGDWTVCAWKPVGRSIFT